MKPFGKRRISRQSPWEDFQRNFAVQFSLPCAKDSRHPAVTNHVGDFIFWKRCLNFLDSWERHAAKQALRGSGSAQHETAWAQPLGRIFWNDGATFGAIGVLRWIHTQAS